MGEFMLNTFLFTDPQGTDQVSCETTISIVDEPSLSMQEKTCWKITLDSKYSNGTKINTHIDAMARASHPMGYYRDKKLLHNFKGFTIIKNDMTTLMIEHLMMDDAELARHTCTITPQSYRRSILKNLVEYID
jgi:hypothetical protein